MARAKVTKMDAAGRKQPTTRRSFGAVRQLPSKTWQASYIGPDGNRYTAPNTFTGVGDADAWLAARRSEIQREVWKPPVVAASERFGPYALTWVENRRARDGKPLAPRTKSEYLAAITRRGLAPLAEMRMADFTPAFLRSWHADRVSNSGASMAGKEARILRAVLNTAVADGLIDRNPCPAALCVSATGIVRRAPSPDELAALIAWFDEHKPHLTAAVLLAAFGGLRLSEWRGLRRKDLELSPTGHYLVSVHSQALRDSGAWLVTAPKSDDGVRQVALPSFVTDAITKHLAEYVGRFPNALVFDSGGNGEYIDQRWRRAWDAARSAVGLDSDVVCHSFRHFYGSTLAASGIGIKQLQAALGHGSAKASLAYLHAAKGADTEVADRFQPLPAMLPNNVKPLSKRGAMVG